MEQNLKIGLNDRTWKGHKDVKLIVLSGMYINYVT